MSLSLLQRAVVIGIMSALLPGIAAWGRSPDKLSKELLGTKSDREADVIVQFSAAPTQHHHETIEPLGGRLKTDLSGAIKGAHYQLSLSRIAELSEDPEITYISLDRPVKGALEFANPAVNADIARANGWVGAGVGIALIDSGITNNTDLKTSGAHASRVVYSESFVPGLTATNDQYGHGTHVAGILAGDASQSTGVGYTKSFRGIAPNANLINLRVLDSQGSGQDSYVINAIQTAIRLRSTYNIRVINLSLGRPVFESYSQDPLCQAVEAAWNAGIVVVVAAGNLGRDNSQGNSGYGTIQAPGNDPLVITVGAMNDKLTPWRSDDVMTSYSSKGPSLIDHVVKPDIVAPGNRVISLANSVGTLYQQFSTSLNRVPWQYYWMTNAPGYSSNYYKLSGTSMAAPIVSGTAALMIQHDATLNPDTVKGRLMKSATKAFPMFTSVTDPVTDITYGIQYDIFTVGAGYVDAWAALNATDTIQDVGGAASPIAVYDGATGQVTITNQVDASRRSAVWGSAAVWGRSAVWGSAAVWGSSIWLDGPSAIWGSSAVWGSSAIWGCSARQGFSAVWGSNALGGNTIVDGSEAITLAINGEN
ncbi:MAG: S8 family peptidase [Bryobacteraceae bacterium]